MTHYEARFLGGPAEGEIRAIPSLVPTIKVAHMPPQPYGWWWDRERAPGIPEIAVETHHYEPNRVVAYYEYQGKR